MKQLLKSIVLFLAFFCMTVLHGVPDNNAAGEFKPLLEQAERIPTRDKWFEIIKLPNKVYALFEPGHVEKVNSFFILGENTNLLYDTGMGFASMQRALSDLMQAEGIAEKKLIVVNSHAHLDHIGDNHEFQQIHAYDHPWRIEKLTMGIPSGDPNWIPYFAELTGARPAPEDFDPETVSIPGIQHDNIKLFQDGHVFDLGDRKFKVIISRSHTEESVILYDEKNRILFTGDVFVPGYFYVLDFKELEKDLKMLANLKVEYHYNTHGAQLVDLSLRQKTLEAVKIINRGKIQPGKKEFLGGMRSVYEVDGMEFWFMPEVLMY